MDTYDEFGNYIGPEFEEDDEEEDVQFQDVINERALIAKDIDEDNGKYYSFYCMITI